MIISEIRLTEKVKNKARKFGSTKEYFPCLIADPETGKTMAALFTKGQIDKAMGRAKKNPEDCEDMAVERKSFLAEIFGW